MKIINLDLVSMPESKCQELSVSSRSLRVSVRNSRSRLDERDWIRETLILVSRSKKRLSLTYGSKSPLSTNLRKIVRGKRRATVRMTRSQETSRPSLPLSLNCLIFFTIFSNQLWCINILHLAIFFLKEYHPNRWYLYKVHTSITTSVMQLYHILLVCRDDFLK